MVFHFPIFSRSVKYKRVCVTMVITAYTFLKSSDSLIFSFKSNIFNRILVLILGGLVYGKGHFQIWFLSDDTRGTIGFLMISVPPRFVFCSLNSICSFSIKEEQMFSVIHVLALPIKEHFILINHLNRKDESFLMTLL